MTLDPNLPRRKTAETQRPRVRVVLGDGREWRVRQAALPSYDRRGGLCLLFEANDVVRRVRDYPEDWFEWPAAELFALSSVY